MYMREVRIMLLVFFDNLNIFKKLVQWTRKSGRAKKHATKREEDEVHEKKKREKNGIWKIINAELSF